jgi:alpha-D-xyloside xylohydrolase
VCVWVNPYLGQASPVFKVAASKGYLLRRKNGDIFQWDLWQTGMGIVDFTNPEAVDWYVGFLEGLFDIGIDAIKTDFGERIPTLDVEWFDSSLDPRKMHNYYAFLYNKIVYEALQNRFGETEAVLFARTATAGLNGFLSNGAETASLPPKQWLSLFAEVYLSACVAILSGLSTLGASKDTHHHGYTNDGWHSDSCALIVVSTAAILSVFHGLLTTMIRQNRVVQKSWQSGPP